MHESSPSDWEIDEVTLRREDEMAQNNLRNRQPRTIYILQKLWQKVAK